MVNIPYKTFSFVYTEFSKTIQEYFLDLAQLILDPISMNLVKRVNMSELRLPLFFKHWGITAILSTKEEDKYHGGLPKNICFWPSYST